MNGNGRGVVAGESHLALRPALGALIAIVYCLGRACCCCCCWLLGRGGLDVKLQGLHAIRVKGLGFFPTVTKVGPGAMMLGACNH